MVQTELEKLENRIDQLAALCRRLQEENHSLREKQEQMSTERAQLIQRNELVRARVEAIISRLKSLEHSS